MDEGDLAKALADRSIVGCWPSRWKVGPPGGPGRVVLGEEMRLQHASMKIQINTLREAENGFLGGLHRLVHVFSRYGSVMM